MGKKDALPPGTTRIKGTDGSITFDGQYVTITHTWPRSAGSGEVQFPLGAILDVAVKNGLVLAALTIVVPGGGVPREGKDPYTVNGLYKSEAALFRDLLLRARASVDAVPMWEPVPEPPTDSAPAPAEESGLVEKLQRLATLHTQGMLTAEEFAIAKAKLLGTSAPDNEAPQPW